MCPQATFWIALKARRSALAMVGPEVVSAANGMAVFEGAPRMQR